MQIVLTIFITLWRWRGVAILAKEIMNIFVASEAQGKVEKKYKVLLIEMLINIVTLLVITLLLPYFLSSDMIMFLLASYYIASISWGIYHAVPIVKCLIEKGLKYDQVLDCILVKESGFWTYLFFGETIKKTIVATIIYMIISSILYVVLFRFLALPYFVENTTGMGILDVIVASVYLPIKEWVDIYIMYFNSL